MDATAYQAAKNAAKKYTDKVTNREITKPFRTKNILDENSTSIEIDGYGWVSDPNTFIMAQSGGVTPAGWFQPYMASVAGKGSKVGYSASPITGLVNCRMGCLDNYFNCIDPANKSNIKAISKWLLNKDGLPMPIIDYQYVRRENGVDFKSQSFSLNEYLYVPCSIQGKAGIRFSMQLDKAGITATHYVSTGHPKGDIHIIVLSITNTATKFVLAEYPSNGWYISPAFVDVITDFSNSGSPTTGDSVSFGLSYADGTWTNVDTCYLMSMPDASMSDAIIQADVIENLLNWRTRKESAISYWDSFWSDYNSRWDKIDPEVRSKGLISVHQIAANTYKGGMCSGIPYWNSVWIRDACWVMRNLGSIAPEFCKEFINWWVGVPDIANKNSYSIDGGSTGPGSNTDNAAVFLLCMGYLWDSLKDVIVFTPLLPQLQSALAYVKTNFSETTHHVYADHPHDYWDDYEEYGADIYLSVELVKYESTIDVFWASALKTIAPCFEALGDTVNRDYCNTTYPLIIGALEDYREVSGALQYAIKTDDSLFSTVVASPGTIYAAHLLNDMEARKSLVNFELSNRLGLRYLISEALISFSNLRTSTTQYNYAKCWGPHIPLVATELSKLSNLSLVEVVKNSFPFGGFSESVKAHAVYSNRVVHNNLSYNFMWCLGEIVTLCETLTDI